MDSLGRRSQLMAVLDKAMEHAQKAQRDAESGQHGLVRRLPAGRIRGRGARRCRTLPTGTSIQRLANSKRRSLGFFITGHPLEKLPDKLLDFHALSTTEICALKSSTGKDETIATAGIITNLRVAEIEAGRFLRASGARRHARHQSTCSSFRRPIASCGAGEARRCRCWCGAECASKKAPIPRLTAS
jgi:DNA polymerase III alpha subunit